MPLSIRLASAVAAGVGAGVFLDPTLMACAPLTSALAAGVAIWAWHRRRDSAGAAATVALVAASVAVGARAQDAALHPPLRAILDQRLGGFALDGPGYARDDSRIVVEGRLLADAVATETGATMRVDVSRIWLGPQPEPAQGGVAVSVSGSQTAAAVPEWRAGRQVRAPMLLRRPARYLNDGVPDFERLLARRGVALVGGVKSAALVEVTAPGAALDEAAGAVRARTRQSLARRVGAIDRQSGAVATAILIGDRGALDANVERRLQEAGTYHVIAISGGNIAILAGLVLGVLWWAGVGDRWAAAAAIAVLGLYAFLTGGGPSVLRATSMAAIYLALRVADQRTAPAHAVAVTAAVLLLWAPLSIADVGFWLTFGATVAIIAGSRRAAPAIPGPLRAAVFVVVASACAELALLPIGAMVFQRVTLAGLIVNLVAVPSMAVVQIGAMLTVAADIAGVTGLAAAAGWATHIAVRGLIDSAALVDVAPWLTWRVPPPSLAVVAAYYAAVVVWFLGLPFAGVRWRRAAGCCAAVLLVWIAAAPASLVRRLGDGRLHLTMIDVGQGDALLLTFPNGRTAMVDAGGVSPSGDFDIGDRVVGPALRARGLVGLDYLAVTHGDPDHLGGARSLVRDFGPPEIWDGVFVAGHEPTAMLRATAAAGRAAWRSLQRGDRLEIGGVELRVHHPPPPDWERQKVRNDDSLVIEARFGRVSMLLTGDIGREVEAALIPTLDLLPIVVLKSPHHGSGTSSAPAFLDRVRPAAVLISCGRGNPYGHPVPYVLERYRQAGAEVFRTDLDGQIDVATDGVSVEVQTFTGRRAAWP